MTEARIERAFLTLPGRQVHYRRAGGGPAVVLLHQSPKSSEELIPMMRLLAPHFTVLAPDTPGYGLSDPIAAPDTEPEIDAFADAVAEFFDGMGLERAGVYGLHTGAAIGTRFAARYPERVAALVANGTLDQDTGGARRFPGALPACLRPKLGRRASGLGLVSDEGTGDFLPLAQTRSRRAVCLSDHA